MNRKKVPCCFLCGLILSKDKGKEIKTILTTDFESVIIGKRKEAGTMLFTNEKLHCFAKDPAVIKYHGLYYLYYTVSYPEKNKIGVGIAHSEDMENWIHDEPLPETQLCEKNGIGAPAAIVLEDTVHLFYQTYGNGENDAICHAVSADGLTFVKDETNPVFHPDRTWCCGRAIDADVCVFHDQLFLYYATRDHRMQKQKVGVASASLDSSFSRNEFREIHSAAVLSPEYLWEQDCIEAPATIVHNGRLYMFYGGAYNCSPQQIGCAVSKDGILFDRVSAKPFLSNGEKGSWNENESGHPYIFEDDDGRVYLFFQGTNDMGRTWYISRREITFDIDGMPRIRTASNRSAE